MEPFAAHASAGCELVYPTPAAAHLHALPRSLIRFGIQVIGLAASDLWQELPLSLWHENTVKTSCRLLHQ